MSNPTAKAIGILALLALAGCDTAGVTHPDMTAENARRADMYEQAFAACMKSLPAGPEQAHYNDWAEVVEQCQHTATTKVGYSTGRYW